MEPQKPDTYPRPEEAVLGKEVAKERAEKRFRIMTVQNETRGVLDRMTADAAQRILNPANSREIRV